MPDQWVSLVDAVRREGSHSPPFGFTCNAGHVAWPLIQSSKQEQLAFWCRGWCGGCVQTVLFFSPWATPTQYPIFFRVGSSAHLCHAKPGFVILSSSLPVNNTVSQVLVDWALLAFLFRGLFVLYGKFAITKVPMSYQTNRKAVIAAKCSPKLKVLNLYCCK